MIYPILYSANETDFKTLGLGTLSDCISCFSREVLRGVYILDLEYPIDGIHFEDIKLRSIIKVKTHDGWQLFRVAKIHKSFKKTASIYCEHISYDLIGSVVEPFTAESAPDALVQLKAHEIEKSPFEFWTDKSTVAKFGFDVPMSERGTFWGVEGSLLDVYGGEFQFDNFLVRLYNRRGKDNGVVVEYGKNLTDAKQDANCASVYTGVLGFWKDSESNELVYTNPKVVKAEGKFDFSKILNVDFTNDFEKKPTQEQLTARVQRYVKENKIGIPKVSISASYVQLQQAIGYEDLNFVESVSLCDVVTVRFPKIGINATAKVVEVVYNSLLDRVEKVTLGEAKPKLTQTINSNSEKIDKVPTIQNVGSMVQNAVNNATDKIGGGGGYIQAAKNPDGSWKELVSLNVPDITQADSVWRWNNGGFGHSSKGYAGPYTVALTQDGAINADMITVGSLNASIIRTGVLASADKTKNFSVDMLTGKARLNDIVATGTFKALSVSDKASTVTVTGSNIVEGGTSTKFAGIRFDNSQIQPAYPFGKIEGIYLRGDESTDQFSVSSVQISTKNQSTNASINLMSYSTGLKRILFDGTLGGVSTSGIDAICNTLFFSHNTYIVDKSSNNLPAFGISPNGNIVVGDPNQYGTTNVYTNAGGTINFFVGKRWAGYIDSKGWHNGAPPKAVLDKMKI